MPAIRRLQNVLAHRDAKAIPVILRTRHCRLILPSILDPCLQLLIPRVCPNAIDNPNHYLSVFIIEAGHERIVHDVLLAQEERVIIHAIFQSLHCMFADKDWLFEDYVDKIFVEEDFIFFSGGLNLAVAHGPFEIETSICVSFVEKVLHDDHKPIKLYVVCWIAYRHLEEAEDLGDHRRELCEEILVDEEEVFRCELKE